MKRVEGAVVLTAEEYEALTKKPKRRKKKTTNTVLVVLGLFFLAFIVTMIVTYWKFQSVPDTLIQMTMGAGGLEATALAAIKVSKVIRGEKTESEE